MDNTRVSKHLGQKSEYKDQYDSELLVREPRSSNRKHLEICDEDLPFVGYDTWNAYEVSGLTFNGIPVACVAKIVYPCNSKYIVESKSIKLYFNSFNMYKCGNTPREVARYISNRAEEDLSKLLETSVRVNLQPAHTTSKGEALFSPALYPTLEKTFNEESLSNLNVNTYVESPGLLEIYESDFTNLPGCYYHSSLLKSNCRVTSQPDWGDVYIYIKGSHVIEPVSLLEYIISFRDECHFHEEICETIYKRLMDIFHPERLCVTCLYARRGGIDINPTRASHEELINSDLINPAVMHVKTGKQ